MNNDFILPISVEKFAAYLDGNLPDDEMSQIDGLISNTPELEELVAVSDSIDQDIHEYLSDDFLYEADTAVFEEDSFEIPLIDTLDTVEQQDFPVIEDRYDEQVGVPDGVHHDIELETEIFGSNGPQNDGVQVTGEEVVFEQTEQEVHEENIFIENTEASPHIDTLLMDN